MRCFFAVDLPAGPRAALVRAREALVEGDGRWRRDKWVAEENLHVTLVFMGSVPEGDVEALLARARDATADVKAGTCSLADVRAVPRAARARMLWARVDDPEGVLAALHASLLAAAGSLAGEDRDREFRPHITLCRARQQHGASPEALAAASSLLRDAKHPVSVRSATLYASTLGPSGPTYREIGSVPLAR